MADDASERQRWVSKNLVQFMGRLSDEDFATLEKLQAAARSNDGGAEQNRLQAITRMANRALRSVGIDPTPQPDASPGGHAAQAASFHRALQDELSAFETTKGRKATTAEASDIINALKETAIRSAGSRSTTAAPPSRPTSPRSTAPCMSPARSSHRPNRRQRPVPDAWR